MVNSYINNCPYPQPPHYQHPIARTLHLLQLMNLEDVAHHHKSIVTVDLPNVYILYLDKMARHKTQAQYSK